MKKGFTEAMSQRTDEELIRIVNTERGKFDSETISAAKAEVQSRNIDKSTYEKLSAKSAAEKNKLEKSTIKSVHSGIRFLNFVIDLFIWFILAFISVILLDHYLPTADHFTINLLAYSVMIGLFLGYYFILEYFFQKTLGKLITRTKVVDLEGEEPEAGAVFLRSLFRLIPFDWAFYFFRRNGLHDLLSNTKVVRDRED